MLEKIGKKLQSDNISISESHLMFIHDMDQIHNIHSATVS